MFLGFLVHRHGIEADDAKVGAIMEMPAPHSQKTLKMGKVSYLRRFIPALAEITFPLSSLLKGKAPFEWNEEHQKAFEAVKAVLTSPQTMIAPQSGKPLLLSFKQ